MTWQKVDDRLATHQKPRRAGLEAMGLWVMCGSMAAQSLSDGVVPAWYVASWLDGEVLAKKLVDANLWHAAGHDCPVCPQPPNGDWIFHEWTQANPSKAEVLADRAAAKERQQRHRAGRNSVTNAVTSPVSHSVSHKVSHGVTTPVTDPVTNTVSHTTPSRPVPRTKSVVTLVGLLTSAGTTDVTTTTINNWAEKNTPDVDIETETAAFLTKIEGQTIRDLAAAWRAWMRKARPTSAQTRVPAGVTTVGLPPPADAPRCEVEGHEHELASNCRICAADALEGPPDVDPEQEGTT